MQGAVLGVENTVVTRHWPRLIKFSLMGKRGPKQLIMTVINATEEEHWIQ